MWTFILVYLIFSVTAEEEEFKIVKLDSGYVRGDKYWNGDYYEFYGIPYASMPTGRNKFKGPEPVKPWDDEFYANKNNILCQQCYLTEDTGDDVLLAGDDECLTMNVLVPLAVNENKLAPVIVYIHSGAFSGGSGNMAKFGYLARHDIVVVSFNYRVGAFGFVCLGNEEIPGNAALKDQVAALRWIKENIRKFGGDPNKITLAGFSVGATMAEVLALSKETDGIISQLILESGSALSPFAINRDPVSTAWNIAQAIGYNGTASMEDLTEFYLNADNKDLAFHSLNYFLTNSTFGFAPCIEKIKEGAVITESPLDILKRGDYKKIPVLTGFSNMEGISRTIKFGTWREEMNENFADFLPADLKFDSEKDKEDVIKAIKQNYFDNKNVTSANLARYIDYFSDAMFKYAIMKSAKLHAAVSDRPVYLYEFSYVGNLNMKHNYMDRIKGASHRDQTAYILDFFGFTNNYRDLDTRERLTSMWSDYVQYGNPTEYESSIISVKWPPYTNKVQTYLEINKRLQLKQGLFNEEYNFWNTFYEKYYWNPTTVKAELNITYNQEETTKAKEVPSKNMPVQSKPDKLDNAQKAPGTVVKNDDLKKEESENIKPVSNLKVTKTIKKLDESGKLVTKVIRDGVETVIESKEKTAKSNEKDQNIKVNKQEQVKTDKVVKNVEPEKPKAEKIQHIKKIEKQQEVEKPKEKKQESVKINVEK
ncbi:esterase E4-like [Colias croceus]|uniref:esterase E4-like n=1 Tax=Colias crocea TaxID=72248 RepID=UPI001E27D400|nr:esterase E4-like [Colias croceus]